MTEENGRDPNAQQDPPGQPYGTPYGQSHGQPYSPQPHPQPYGQPGYGQPGYGQPGSDKRPATVTAAGVITLVTAGLSLVGFVIALVAVLVARESFVTEVRASPGFEDIDADSAVVLVMVMMLVLALWCVGAMVLAVFAMRGANGARVGLVVSASLSALLSLAGIASLIAVVPLLASIAAIVCLFTGGANAWYAGRGGAGHPGTARGPVA